MFQCVVSCRIETTFRVALESRTVSEKKLAIGWVAVHPCDRQSGDAGGVARIRQRVSQALPNTLVRRVGKRLSSVSERRWTARQRLEPSLDRRQGYIYVVIYIYTYKYLHTY